jgi:hypothetical protein
MSQILVPLGYGKLNIIEVDTFTRMLNNQILDAEEVRLDKPISYQAGFEFMGVAPAGADVEEPLWCIIRRTWDNKRAVRLQYKQNVKWSDRFIISW